MLEYLLVEWTDFRSVCWFELNLSSTWIPEIGVAFLSAVFEKLASTHTVIFDLFVTGTFHVSTCQMLKIDALTARISSLNSICNGESPHIYFVWVSQNLGGQFSLCKWPPPPILWFGAHNVVIHLWKWVKLTNCVNKTGLRDPLYATFACHVTYLILIRVWVLVNYYLLLLF